MEVSATNRYAGVSPSKVRLVLRHLPGRSIDDALDLLKFMPTPHARLVAKIVKSAASNAENNYALDVDGLYIKHAFANDARLLPPNGGMTTGRDAIRAIFGGMLDAGISIDLTSIEARISGDTGYEVGTYVMKDGDTVVDTGKFIEPLRGGADGVGRITTDIGNSALPVAAAPPA